MKTKTNIFTVCCFFLLGQLFYSCQKEETEEEYEVGFGIGVSNSNENLALKSASDFDLGQANHIVITIKKSDESSTKYNSTEISIYKLNGSYYSQKILLPPGSYKLTEFLIADSTGSIIFAVPLTGSALADAITQPLPILFSVLKNNPTIIQLEVTSTEGSSCSDFGLVWFPLKEINIIKVHVAVVDKHSSQFLSAELKVYNDSCTRTFTIQPNADNLISIPDKYSNYNIEISKEGYGYFLGHVSLDSLKILAACSSGNPLLIELERYDGELVTDIDGNIYHTVKIGNQIWMTENLKTTHFNDGTYVNDEGLQYYDTMHTTVYGRLYLGYSVMNGKLAPKGWHVATYDDWNTLINYLGGTDVAGGKLKEAGTTHWKSPNLGATNETGFTGLPGGYRGYPDAILKDVGELSFWWTSTEYIEGTPYYVLMGHDFTSAWIKKTDGFTDFSVRCIKD